MNRVLIIFFLFLLLFGCQKKETAKVAFIGSFSGKLSDNSINGRNSIELYLDNLKKENSLVDYKIYYFDDKSDIQTLSDIISEIKKEGIKFIIGPFSSGYVQKTLPLIKNDDLLMIGPVSAADFLEKADDNFIKMYPSIKTGADKLAEYSKSLKIKKLKPIFDLANKDYGDIWINSFKDILRDEEVEILEPYVYKNPTKLNYSEIVESVLSVKPDAVLLIANTFDAANFCQDIRKRSKSTLIVSSSWSYNTEFLTNTGKNSDGVLFAVSFKNDSSDVDYSTFKRDYLNKYNRDAGDFFSAYCYESFMVLDEGINSARSVKPEKVKEAIIKISKYKGLQGDFFIDRFGDAKRDFYIVRVENGMYKVIDFK